MRLIHYIQSMNPAISLLAMQVTLMLCGAIGIVVFIGNLPLVAAIPSVILLGLIWWITYKLIEGFRLRRENESEPRITRQES